MSMVRFITGMQIAFPLELLDEGIERSLDNMKQRSINTVILQTHMDYQDSYHWGVLTHNPKRTRMTASGFFYDPRAEYYEHTGIKPVKTNDPNLRDTDPFRELVVPAHDRCMKVFAWLSNRIPNSNRHSNCLARDVMNRPIPHLLCLNNPNVRGLYAGMLNDLIDNYEIDGVFLDFLDHSVQFGFKTLTDELAEVLGYVEMPKLEMGLTCFCHNCVKLAREKGVNAYSIRNGLIRGVKLGWIPDRLEKLCTVDETMRFLTEVPEYLDWLRFRAECLTEFHAELYGLAKRLKPRGEVALDIYGPADAWKYASDLRSLTRHCDWIKPMFYSGTFPSPPLSPQGIYSEIRKLIQETAGQVDVVAGINAVSQSPEYVKEAVVQSLKAESRGVIISWDYGLIAFENMDAARQGLSDAIGS